YRKNIILATKFGKRVGPHETLRDASPKHIAAAIDNSLRRLKTDWVDLYQLHVPDPNVPLHETLGTLNDLIRVGKIRFIGCCNLPAEKVAQPQLIASKHGVAGFVSCQDKYNLIERDIELDLLPVIRENHLGLLPYFALASGLLTGKYKRNLPLPAGS